VVENGAAEPQRLRARHQLSDAESGINAGSGKVGRVTGQELEELIAHASALEKAADWPEADRVYAAVFREAVRLRRIDSLVDALRREADMRRRHASTEEAEDLALLSFEIAERNALTQAAARALNVLAAIRHGVADFSEAGRLFTASLERAREIDDEELIGLVCQNLGVIANIEGRLRDARTLYLESIASSVRSTSITVAMLAYHNLGMVCTDLGDYVEAELYFDRGIELAERLNHVPTLTRFYLNRAEPLTRVGEFAGATASLDRAEALARETADREVLVDIPRFRAAIAKGSGDFDRADDFLQLGLRLSGEAGMKLERAEALDALAQLRRAQGRGAEAVEVLRAARDEYEALGATREYTRTVSRLAEWSEGS
jgi:tetratricopeptide (TPR) repeat protein